MNGWRDRLLSKKKMGAAMSDLLLQAAAWIGGFVFFTLKMDKRLSVLEYKMDDLRDKQAKYNHLQERMVEVEQRSKSNTHRIDEMERFRHD